MGPVSVFVQFQNKEKLLLQNFFAKKLCCSCFFHFCFQYVCILCQNKPLIASYTKLRLHLRAVHRVQDRDFVHDRDEPKFRHPFLFMAENRPVNAPNIGHDSNAPIPADELMRVFSSVISDAISFGIFYKIMRVSIHPENKNFETLSQKQVFNAACLKQCIRFAFKLQLNHRHQWEVHQIDEPSVFVPVEEWP